jgi:Fe-S cluster assembly scaffold protein SufB
MNNEDKIKKQMEFMLNQQARFDANIGRLEEKHAELQDIVGRLAITTAAGLEALVEAQLKTEENISSLTERMERMNVSLTARMTALAEAQAHTDDRLNTLINVVERQISEGHNGGPKP